MGGRVRNVLLRLEVRPAGKLSRCKHDQRHTISKGELRLIVKDPGALGSEAGYCSSCGLAMLEAARVALEAYTRQLSTPTTEHR